MELIGVEAKKKRSGPVFLDRGGELISKVYETESREIRLGGTDGLLVSLPPRRSVFVIDARGVWKRTVGVDLPGALAVGLGLTLLLAIVSRVVASRRSTNWPD